MAPNEHVPSARSVEQLDVGQGDAALVIAADGSAGLIDAGDEHALAPDRWIRVLASRGITHLDWIALTHLDRDHAGGLGTLASGVPVACLATSAAELATPRGRKWAAGQKRAGLRVEAWESGCVPFPAIGPSPADSRSKKPNARMSAVLVPLEGGGFYLSPGDADARDEPRIGRWAVEKLTELRVPPGPRILKVSHHGSRTSSAPEFLRLIRPDEAWISAGTGNRFGHPAVPVVERLSRAGARILRTDRDGSLRAGVDRRPRRRRPR